MDNNRAADQVLKLVMEHYRASGNPLLLSQLGNQLNAEVRHQLKTRSGTLKRMIEQEFSDSLVIIEHPRILSYVAVAPANRSEEVERLLRRRKNVSLNLESLPRSLLIAFCKPLGDGERIFYSRLPPYRYVLVKDVINDVAFVEIDRQYRMPGLWVGDIAKLSAKDAQDLQTNITQWAAKNEVELNDLVEHQLRSMPSASSDDSGPLHRDIQPDLSFVALPSHESALSRLIEAQPVDLRGRVAIPADIALILLRHR